MNMQVPVSILWLLLVVVAVAFIGLAGFIASVAYREPGEKKLHEACIEKQMGSDVVARELNAQARADPTRPACARPV
jgi:hypothetical protein